MEGTAEVLAAFDTLKVEVIRVSTWAIGICTLVAGALAGIMIIRKLFSSD